MALKPDRQIDSEEISYFLNETAERGSFVVVSTGGSGVAMDSSVNVATVASSPSGQKCLGIITSDFVNVDRTRQQINWHKDQQASGDKANIVRKGWLTTNKILGTATAGQTAYLAESGNVRGTSSPITNIAVQPTVGRFISGKDEAGYAKVYIDV